MRLGSIAARIFPLTSNGKKNLFPAGPCRRKNQELQFAIDDEESDLESLRDALCFCHLSRSGVNEDAYRLYVQLLGGGSPLPITRDCPSWETR